MFLYIFLKSLFFTFLSECDISEYPDYTITHCQVCNDTGKPWTYPQWLFTSSPGVFGLVGKFFLLFRKKIFVHKITFLLEALTLLQVQESFSDSHEF